MLSSWSRSQYVQTTFTAATTLKPLKTVYRDTHDWLPQTNSNAIFRKLL